MDELEDRPVDELQDHVDFGSDTELESEIEVIVCDLNPWRKVTRLKSLRPGNRPGRP